MRRHRDAPVPGLGLFGEPKIAKPHAQAWGFFASLSHAPRPIRSEPPRPTG